MTSQPPNPKPPASAPPPASTDAAAARLRDKLASLKRPSQPSIPALGAVEPADKKPSQPALSAIRKPSKPAVPTFRSPSRPSIPQMPRAATPPAPVAAVAVAAEAEPPLEPELETSAELTSEISQDNLTPEPIEAAPEPAAEAQPAQPAQPAALLQDLLAQQATLSDTEGDTFDEEDQAATRIGPPPEVRVVPVPRLVPLAALEEFPELASLPELPEAEGGGGVEVTRKVDRSLLPSAPEDAPQGHLDDGVDEDEATRRSVRPPQLVAALINDPDSSEQASIPAPTPHEAPKGEQAPAPKDTQSAEEKEKGRGRLPRFSEMKVQRVEMKLGGPGKAKGDPRLWIVVALVGAVVLLLFLLLLL